MRKLCIAAVAIIIALSMGGSSQADLTTTFAGTASHGVVITTPCVGGQLDFSDPTGCNTTLYMVILR